MREKDGKKQSDMKTGIVVIGRNEGQRLVACLNSLPVGKYPVVYVDSGSSDGSLQQAKKLGADVINLDKSIPFSAARARNEGLKHLNENWPGLTFVQFVDGDCLVVDDWLNAAEGFLIDNQDVAVVCGRRREAHPNATIYNSLCDVEWDTPIGGAIGCGGDAMMRIPALLAVKGYRDGLIAAEDSELCLRLRERGWKIWRLPDEMTLHDANIRYFRQWWRRASRSGFAYAEVFALHANSPLRIFRRELMRAIIWGLILPLAVLVAAISHVAVLGVLLLYPLQVARIAIGRGVRHIASWQYGAFMTVAKFAEAHGVLKYLVSRLTRRETPIMEYK